MKNPMRVKYLLLLSMITLLWFSQARAQMKIGNHPTKIGKASILELESPNQGLRLTRVPDTATVNQVFATMDQEAVDSANGMIVFQTKDSSLYLRAGGGWHRLLSADDLGVLVGGEPGNTFWDLTGNAGTDSSVQFLGTTDLMGMRIGTNSESAILIDRNGSVAVMDSLFIGGGVSLGQSAQIADSLLVGASLHVQDSVTLETVSEALGTDYTALVIGSDGVIRKKNLELAASHISLEAVTGGSVGKDFNIDSISVPNTFILNLPYASGIRNQAANGLVDTVTQSFAGTKSFRDSVAVGKDEPANSTLEVNGNVSLAAHITTADFNMGTTTNAEYKTIICNVSGQSGISGSPTITVTLPSPLDGRIYTIKKIGDENANQINAYVTVLASTGTTFGDGGTSANLYNNWTSITVQAMQGKWYIVGH